MFDLAACPLCGAATDNVFCGGCSRDAREWETMNGRVRGSNIRAGVNGW